MTDHVTDTIAGSTEGQIRMPWGGFFPGSQEPQQAQQQGFVYSQRNYPMPSQMSGIPIARAGSLPGNFQMPLNPQQPVYQQPVVQALQPGPIVQAPQPGPIMQAPQPAPIMQQP